MTAAIFDDVVLARPYFEPEGLILAFDQDTLVGFAHGGFGPTASGEELDRTTGAVCQLLVRPDASDAVGAGLLAECERYLQERGATRFVGGGTERLAPFYLGLYGGGKPPAVLQSDRRQVDCFQAAGYVCTRETSILECSLGGFRPVVNRQTIALRRECQVRPSDPREVVTWWDACHRGQCNLMRFSATAGNDVSCATFWDIEPLASSWGSHAMGLWELNLATSQPAGLIALHLLGESMRAMQSLGISVVEIQVDDEDTELLEVCLKLGFAEVDRGMQFERAV